MNFRISVADIFTIGDEQKSVKTTAFDLQMNPANQNMNYFND